MARAFARRIDPSLVSVRGYGRGPGAVAGAALLLRGRRTTTSAAAPSCSLPTARTMKTTPLCRRGGPRSRAFIHTIGIGTPGGCADPHWRRVHPRREGRHGCLEARRGGTAPHCRTHGASTCGHEAVDRTGGDRGRHRGDGAHGASRPCGSEEFDERYRPLVWPPRCCCCCEFALLDRRKYAAGAFQYLPRGGPTLLIPAGRLRRRMASAVLRRGRPVRFCDRPPGILCLKGIPGTSLSQGLRSCGELPDVVRVGPCAAADVAGTRSQAAAGTCSQASAGTGCIGRTSQGRLTAYPPASCPSARLPVSPVCPSARLSVRTPPASLCPWADYCALYCVGDMPAMRLK